MDSEHVVYRFELVDREIEFRETTRPRELENGGTHPEWARLGNQQCACCPLKESDCTYCPAATRINEVMEAFADHSSIERAKVTVTTGERSYFKDCDLQVGLNSLIGLMMATSGCPVLKGLGAMASFHIPFCTTRETLHRTVGSYLIQQYFKQLEGGSSDWELKQLKKLYDELEGLNRDFSKRIKDSASSDALSNAIFIFFATSVVVASSLDKQLIRHQDYLTNAPEGRACYPAWGEPVEPNVLQGMRRRFDRDIEPYQ
jgi:hypothetical protein